jgi:acid phosphatase
LSVLLLALLLIGGCQAAQPSPPPAPPDTGAAPQAQPQQPSQRPEQQPPQPQPSAAKLPKPDHVVIVVEENHAYDKIIGSDSAPYINRLAGQGALFTNSHANAHPSQPNYLILFSGSDQGVKNDSCGHTFQTPNLGSELLKTGLSFAGYSEDLPAPGSTKCSSGKYARKHSPWVSFANLPAATNLPFSGFPDDYAKLPTVSFVIPNLDNDMHDGDVRRGDNWLQQHLHGYVEWAQSHNSLLIVTWDEDDFSKKNHIPTLFVGPMVRQGNYDEPIDHLRVLRTLEDMYGLPHLGNSGKAEPITDVWMQNK